MIQTSDLQEKYSFLLQPIKDLAKNFEVDIFKILDEYITELDKLEFSLEDGKTLNFAEAAMLIQGSACVWGRKVEYLHKLVGQTLTMLANKKNNNGKNAENGNNDDEIMFDEDDIKFLSLNDNKTSINNRTAKCRDVLQQPMPAIATLALEIDNCNRGTTLERASENDNIFHVRDFVTVCSTPHHAHVSVLNLESHGGFLHSMICTPLYLLKENAAKQISCQVNAEIGSEAMEENMCDDNDPIEPCNTFDTDEVINEVSESEHTVKHGMNLRNAGDKVSPKPPKEENAPPVIELLDEHVSSEEYSSKRLRLSKASLRRRKAQSVPFIRFLFDTHSQSMKYIRTDMLSIVGYILENSRHERKICELRREIRRKLKMKNKGLNHEIIEEDYVISSGQQVTNNKYLLDEYSDNDDDYNIDDINDVIQQNQQSEVPEEGAPMTYEELVQVNVRRFYEEAIRFKQDNLLLKRVKEWEDRVIPLLEEQNSRSEFDIHDCGDKMVSSFSNIGECKRFTDCVTNLCSHSWEICRMFAATLQLANDGNFIISKSDEVNSMSLQLLTTKRSRERLAQYNDAPLQG